MHIKYSLYQQHVILDARDEEVECRRKDVKEEVPGSMNNECEKKHANSVVWNVLAIYYLSVGSTDK